MNHHLQLLYQSTLAKYKKFKNRFDKNIESGFFYEFSDKKQRQLVARIERLKRRLTDLKTQIKLAVASGALVISLAATSTLKAQELGPFVQNGVNNPFKPPSSPNWRDQHPAAVDIDNDGDLDVFVGNTYGRIEFLRNDGNSTTPFFNRFDAFNTENPANGIDVGYNATPTFADLDGDGDFDLIVGERYQYLFSPFSNLRFYENTGDEFNPVFVSGSFPNPVDDLFSDAYYGHPEFGDIDNDGDLDALVGGNLNTSYSSRETITFWRNNGALPLPQFIRESGASNPISIVNPDFGGTLDRAAPALVDIDNDGDLDIFIGEANGTIRFFPNQGTEAAPSFPSEYTGTQNPLDGFTFYSHASPEFADLDFDGDFDLIVGTGDREVLQFLRNDGTNTNPNFVLTGRIDNPFDGIDTGYDAAPATVDLDGDGFLDVVIGQKYSSTLLFFTNNQDGTFTERTGSTENPFDNLFGNYDSRPDPAFADIDDDGDFDLFVAIREYDDVTFDYNAEIRFFRNSGSNVFVEETSPITTFLANTNRQFGITLGNLNTSVDNDIDAIIGTQNNDGVFIFSRNDGTASVPNFIDQPTSGPPFGSINISPGFTSYTKPQFVDLDHDGDLDVVSGVVFSNLSGQLLFFQNDGAGNLIQQTGTNSPFFDNGIGANFDFGSDSHPAFIDFDNDGDLDVLVGLDPGTIILLENQNIPPFIVSNSMAPIEFIEGDNAVVLNDVLDVNDPTTDPIIGGKVVIQNYEVGEDILSFTPDFGVTGNFVTSGPDAGSLILTAGTPISASQFAAILRSVTYENVSDNPTSTTRNIDFQAIDFDNTNPAPGGFVINVNITPVNNAPVVLISTATDLSYTENDAPIAIDAAISVTDVDNVNLTGATISISSDFFPDEDILNFTDQNGITGNYNPSTGILTLTGSSSVANYQAALRSITYTNSSDDPNADLRTVDFIVNDGSVPSALASRSINVIPVNDAPNIVSTNGQIDLSYIQDDTPVIIDDLIEITDLDDSQLSSASVVISGYVEGDLLVFTNQNGIDGVFVDGTLTLTGTATLEQYRAALRTVTFSSSNGSGSRTINFTVNDGTDQSQPYSRTINIEGVSTQPPQVNTTPATTQVGSIVTLDLCDIITDPDNEFEELTVIIVSTLSGAITTIEGCDLEIDYTATSFSGRDEIVVRATDPDGNSDENTLFIEVEEVVEPGGEIVIYNAVSPNNDGANDWWEIVNLTTPNKIEIFNRWGDSVKTLTDYIGNTPNNQLDDLPTGTYFYKMNTPQGDFEGFLVIKK